MSVPTYAKFDPVSLAQEIREQMASARRRIGFLCGAGTSIYAGVPGLVQLTGKVASGLTIEDKECYDKVIAATQKDANLNKS